MKVLSPLLNKTSQPYTELGCAGIMPGPGLNCAFWAGAVHVTLAHNKSSMHHSQSSLFLTEK